MTMQAIIHGLEQLLGIAKQVAPNAHVDVTVGGNPGVINPDTLIAGLESLAGIDFAAIKDEFNKGQIVTAGAMGVDDVLKLVAKVVPGVGVAEAVVQALVIFSELGPAHNSGEDGIGADPAGNGNVAA